ncbi:MAG: tRNA lysidine(34) synthetase TilS [Flavobacteriaceae bacterium]|nr:tRNA lysidine(34) synthetase TilS [Flavobacteriaceae bacterium]
MKTDLQVHIRKSFPELLEKTILLACSGGLDSVVLLSLLKDLDCNIAIAHCNFLLRGQESDEDESFVEHLAAQYNYPFHSQRFDTKKYANEQGVSIQMAARELRYTYFEQLQKEYGYDYLVTAHHADDNLETFLINASRGTGIRGLLGIPTSTETLKRPLISSSREELEQYAKQKELHWREDSSNRSEAYLRNNLRKSVIPAFKKAVPNLLAQLSETQKYLRGSAALVEDYMVLVYASVVTETEDAYSIDIQKLNDLPNKGALLYQLLHPFGFTAWDDVEDLLSAQTGKQIYSKTHRLLKNRDQLLLTLRKEAPVFSSEEIEDTIAIPRNIQQLDSPVPLIFHSVESIDTTSKDSIYVDAEKLQFPLILRRPRKGDVFQPFGMKGKKKLSKYFKDEKLSLAEKEKVWLLCSNSEIVWVLKHRMADPFKVTSATSEILKITTR